MILVTGATGNIGTELVRLLLEKKEKFRVLARDPAKAKAKLGASVDVVKGDLDQPETVAAALAGVDKGFLLTSGPNPTANDLTFIQAAKKANLKHVVMISSAGVPRGVGGGPSHVPGEKELQASGLPWTILRPTEFMTNALWWSETIRPQGAFYLCTGEGKASMIHPRDIAAAAAKVLTSSGHEGKIYELTGPEAISMARAAELLAAASGRPVKYVAVPESAIRDGMASRGMPPDMVNALVGYYVSVANGKEAGLTDTLQQLTGSRGLTFEAWAKENAAAFRS